MKFGDHITLTHFVFNEFVYRVIYIFVMCHLWLSTANSVAVINICITTNKEPTVTEDEHVNLYPTGEDLCGVGRCGCQSCRIS